MTWNKTKSITLVTSTAKLEEVYDRLYEAPLLAVDCETTGLDRFCKVIGIGFAVSEDEAYYVPISVYSHDKGLYSPWQANALPTVYSFITSQLMKSKRLIGHNGQFDAKAIANTFEVECINNFIADTCLLKHTAINEEPPHGLKDLAAKYLDPEASNSQEDLKDSVIENGGRWLKSDKEMYKGDWKLIGRYCAFDVLFTFGLYNRFIPEIKKQGLEDLWEKEVMPLNAVTYELNTTGLDIDVPYFEKLKKEMSEAVIAIEDEIYAQIEDTVKEYEWNKLLEDCTITPRSELGRMLNSLGCNLESASLPLYKDKIYDWYKNKHGLRRVFNLDSIADKAYLLYDVLGFECINETKTGKRSVTKADMERLEAEHEDNPVINLISRRSKEKKMLTTYVEPFLEQQINGRIYPTYNQTGTTTARYSSNNPNFQNLPAGDKRIRAGVVAPKDWALVDADYESLEPKSFSFMAQEESIRKVYTDGLDFYSQVYITVMGATEYSADPKAPNFLKKVKPELRQSTKAWALGFAYGMSEFKLAKMLKIETEEAQVYKKKYFKAFGNLLKYHKKCEFTLSTKGGVSNIMGRLRRAKLVPMLYLQGIRSFEYNDLRRNFSKIAKLVPDMELKEVVRECNNEIRNAYNFPIQSLAASVVNHACINFQNKVHSLDLKARLCCQVHDQITVLCPKNEVPVVSKLLKEAMEDNLAANKVWVAMKADPVVVERWSDAK